MKANSVEVRVVSPIVTRGFRKVSDLKALEYPGVTVSHAEIKTGPGSIESEFEWPQGGHSIYIRDPSGNSIEFAEPRIWGF